MGRVLKLGAILIGLLLIAVFFLTIPGLAKSISNSSFAQWYAYVASLNNFTFAALIAVPLLMAFLPFGLLIEALWDKGDALEQEAISREREDYRPMWLTTPVTPQRPPLDEKKRRELEEKTREGTARTAAYLADFFGPEGPQPPRPKRRTSRRYPR